jgi:hypothetical protein
VSKGFAVLWIALALALLGMGILGSAGWVFALSLGALVLRSEPDDQPVTDALAIV